MLRQQGFLDRIKLPANAPNTMQQFRFVSNCVSHTLLLPKTSDTPTGYPVNVVRCNEFPVCSDLPLVTSFCVLWLRFDSDFATEA